MAFTVENGTGLAAANAYLSVADFKAHHDDRGGDYSAYNDTAIQQAIVQATDYVDKRYGRRFRGCKASKAQALEWPRQDAFTDDDYTLDGVPAILEKAIAEYAMIALQLGRNLAPLPAPDFGVVDPDTGEVSNDSSGRIIEKKEKVGPIEDQTKFSAGDRGGAGTGSLLSKLPEYPQADLWMEELIESYTSRRLYRG